MPTRPPHRAVQPGGAEAVAPARRSVEPGEDPPRPGELICGQCRAGNLPVRRYCRRCGAALADAPVAVRPPWWRRLLARRVRRPHAAGERPPRRRRWRTPRFAVWLVVLLAAAAAGYAFRAEALGAVESVRDRVSKP
ncbi:hypothetical protein [Streptomyces sp. NBC_00454]|uniref:hypothetical protein n=1 Tax=Streptomyces sp. NBC_00454 TaxID=2975747 RepID=UPI0030DF880A